MRSERASNVMDRIDKLPPPVRAVVHEYGWYFVQMMLDLGVKSAPQMRHIAYAVSAGRGAGGVIREPPNEAEIDAAATIIAMHFGHRKGAHDEAAARGVLGHLWNKFHWGRCQCVK